MDRNEFQRNLDEISKSINPLEMTNHALQCPTCNTLLKCMQYVINSHMEEKRGK